MMVLVTATALFVIVMCTVQHTRAVPTAWLKPGGGVANIIGLCKHFDEGARLCLFLCLCLSVKVVLKRSFLTRPLSSLVFSSFASQHHHPSSSLLLCSLFLCPSLSLVFSLIGLYLYLCE